MLKRRLVVTAKDAYILHAIELADGESRMDGVGIYRELKERKDKWETDIVMEEVGGESYIDPTQIGIPCLRTCLKGCFEVDY